MMSRRVMGKASFAHVQDKFGQIQIYVRREDVGEENYAGFKAWDIGDIIGVKGTAFRTKTGEVSVHATEVTLLSKSLQVLPEKYPRPDQCRSCAIASAMSTSSPIPKARDTFVTKRSADHPRDP